MPEPKPADSHGKRAREETVEDTAHDLKQRKLDGFFRSHSAPALAASVASPLRSKSAPVLGQELKEATSLRLKGTSRMDIRGRSKNEVVHIDDSDEETQRKPDAKSKSWPRVLRISAGRVAAAAGLHRHADPGEVFIELLYQDLPDMLLADAADAGVEIVSPQAERARLLAKSGEAEALEAALREAFQAPKVEAAQAAREAIAKAVEAAEHKQSLTAEEARDLRQTLELEVNLDFGARHEDTAIEAYQERLGSQVYGQQHRVCLPLPADGATHALCQAFPAPHEGARPRTDIKTAAVGQESNAPSDVREVPVHRPFFLLTGFVDGLVDVRRRSPAPTNLATGGGHRATTPASTADSPNKETLVVEVKHRMGRIKDPPEIYDVVQLCTYCRALGCVRGDLVQCLRSKAGGQSNVLHVTRIDFSEGSPDRKGWDEQILPKLYDLAAAIYAAREDKAFRLRLLAAEPELRRQIVAEACPHMDY